MSVKLAAQTLSTSVADAIDFLRKDKRMINFIGSEATSKFIRTIDKLDKLFDICNSSSPKGRFSKSLLNLVNLEERVAELEANANYLRGLRDSHNKKLTDGRRKTAFIGFLVTINCVINLSRGLFKYVLTYKLNQDNLETLSIRIRRRGGWNNNPTTLQFKYALRACL
ncbi:THAP domain-containing protein 9 [Plakobranchus ocellatus]|uniref:THAP domain-containing protein 9 n=1 Tax=Plakobranchus ocellatus TaxID=259542 RepID=A0AAV4DLU0_9GAST|nr:THAP domain-containing protein 9 [Plakobranchus ocellatus]